MIIYTLPVNVRRSIVAHMTKGRILVVEDNIDTYELVRFILEKNGYITFLAMNGRDGVNAARKQTPDLIIMDLSMPEMDGWTATGLIKQDEKTSKIPLIVVTAHALPGDRKRALDVGCNEYITKPMDLLDLVDTVNLWVNKVNLM
jgi:two-component system cell cycle response regulator DivK